MLSFDMRTIKHLQRKSWDISFPTKAQEQRKHAVIIIVTMLSYSNHSFRFLNQSSYWLSKESILLRPLNSRECIKNGVFT
jgi:hypothetical protein